MLLSALAIPTASARSGFGGHESNILQPTPLSIASDGVNVTVLVRAQITTMGNASTLTYNVWYNPIGGSLVYLALNAELTYPHMVNFSADFEPEQIYVLGLKVWFEPWEDNTVAGDTLLYTVPALADIGVDISHPFAPGIQSLGLPVNIMLGVLGFIWMLIAFTITAWFKMDPQTTTTALMVVTSFNLFMRFWPTVLLILLAFLLGYLVVHQFGGAGGEGE